MPAVGRNVPRKDARAKVSGAARYIDDLTFPGMLYGRTVRSTIACGELESIAVEAPGCVVVGPHDIPGENIVVGHDREQPCLVEREIRHVAEPLLLLAHEDRDALRAAQVNVVARPRTPLLDPRLSERVFKRIDIVKGDVERAMAAADLIVEGTYTTGHQEHVYIETNGVIAVPEADGGVTVYGSMQCPYFVHEALRVLLGTERVRAVQVETGGGFGGKEEYPSMLACHAALLARKSGRPVKMVYDRGEDMLATTKRHPSIVRHRTGVSRDGRLLAIDVDVLLDAGAYSTLSPVVLSRGTIHATGPYRCDDVRLCGRAVFTNTPPNGAFRGFGAPQTHFAAEVHMERIAEALGMDPVELRDRNALCPGDTTATGQVLGPDCCARDVLHAAVERAGFHRLRSERKGVGLAMFFHGSGFTGGGEVWLASKVSLELTPTGARVLVASTEMGQGTRTMLAQIAADATGLPYEAIEVADPDTAIVPNSGPTVASRTCMIVGRILERCGLELRRRLAGRTPAEYLAAHGPLVVTLQYERPPEMTWDDATYRGDAYGAYGWGCNVVELDFDPDTCEARARRITSVCDVGRAIHPQMVAGQIEGGVAQGAGYALLENVLMKDGGMANASLTNYLIPTALDAPEIDAVVLEHPYEHGPYGAKGIGEMPIDGVAPAVANALRHLGYDLRDLPATPERISTCASR